MVFSPMRPTSEPYTSIEIPSNMLSFAQIQYLEYRKENLHLTWFLGGMVFEGQCDEPAPSLVPSPS